MYRQRLQQIARAAHFPILRYSHDAFRVTPQIVAELRQLGYVEQWQKALKENWFHIELEDHSLFLFNEPEGGLASYSFIHCPLAVPTYRQFLAQLDLEYTTQARRENVESYEEVMGTASLKPHITPIRFDHDPTGYRPGIHPLSHVHIGLANNVRIAVRRTMTALSFVLFVMRHMYPQSWERLLRYSESLRLQRHLRLDCIEVGPEWWSSLDQLELYLG
jgi:hypothetical protein